MESSVRKRNILKNEVKEEVSFFFRSIANSYSSIFFSRNKHFGLCLIFITMLYPAQGVCGLFCCMLVNSIAISLSLNRYKIESGIYGFNAAMVGVALGAIFPYNAMLVALIFALSILVLLLTIIMDGWLQKYGLPFLAFPFLFCLWIVLLIYQQMEGEVGFDVSVIASENALEVGGFSAHALSGLPFWQLLPDVVLLYFRSIGFVFFQSDVISGLLLTVALLCVSRIAFVFSFLGFACSYLLYNILDLELFHIPFSFFGFNFIFTSLVLGGCYLVPSKTTMLWVALLVPVQYMIVYASTRLLSYFLLPTFSLAFCSVSFLFLYLMKMREYPSEPYFSYFLEATPEDNVYYHRVNYRRFDYLNYLQFSLPFMGEWKVSQSYDGAYTHKGLWRHAIDFSIECDGRQYANDGDSLSDYYCYSKPVIAAGNAEVVAVCNDVYDNPVGEVNKRQNWGNYVLLKHAEGVYSLSAHLKNGSIILKVGDKVQKGDQVGLCGNSGLSPYPHLHFQFQSLSYVGAPTLAYKFTSYMNMDATPHVGIPILCGIPMHGQTVGNVVADERMAGSFNFVPSQRFYACSEKFGKETWEVRSEYGYLLFYCWETGARAWFARRTEDFCFQRFEGGTDSNLFYFYLSNYRVLFSSLKYDFSEELPLTFKKNNLVGCVQDLCAPLFLFMKFTYRILPSETDNRLRTICTKHILGKIKKLVSFESVLGGDFVKEVRVDEGGRKWNMEIDRIA